MRTPPANCPFGGRVCGVGDPCPLHDRLVGLQTMTRKLLRESTCENFRRAAQEDGLKPTSPEAVPTVAERERYRGSKRGAT